MATAVFTLTRSLPALVMDLATTKQRRATLDADMYGTEPTNAQLSLADELDARVEALEREFDAAFYNIAGVSWHLAEGARS